MRLFDLFRRILPGKAPDHKDDTQLDQVAYFRSHPPRCIAGFVAQPAELPSVEFDGHASLSQLDVDSPPGVTINAPEHINPIFALRCHCGSRWHYVHGYRLTNPDLNIVVFLSPLVLECSTCTKKTDLLDTIVHGYNGELGIGSELTRGRGTPEVFECTECGRQSLEIFARFEYPDDLFNGDIPEFVGREHDLFTWFSLVGKCSQCSNWLNVTDFECA